MYVKKWPMIVAAAAFLLVAMVGAAEDLTGSEKLICAGAQATYCDTSGDCEIGMPWNWGMPHFVEIHLDDRMLRTTSAAERPRQTPILQLCDQRVQWRGLHRHCRGWADGVCVWCMHTDAGRQVKGEKR
jgi:hypothetical protein